MIVNLTKEHVQVLKQLLATNITNCQTTLSFTFPEKSHIRTVANSSLELYLEVYNKLCRK